MPSDDRPQEEFEHIPWSQLESRARVVSGRSLLAGAAVVGAVVIGFFGARLGSADTPRPALPPATTLAAPIADTSTTTEVSLPQLYREADLLAVMPDEEIRLAVMRAEWFVTDYFSVAGGGGDTPDVPRQTYVEWARAYRVDGADPSRYAVAVGFRLLVAGDNGAFDRLPLQAVEVDIARDADGALAVADIPRPLPAPRPDAGREWPEPAALPPTVVAAAQDELADSGLVGEVVGGHAYAGGWRVVVRAAPPGAPAFPMSVLVGEL